MMELQWMIFRFERISRFKKRGYISLVFNKCPNTYLSLVNVR